MYLQIKQLKTGGRSTYARSRLYIFILKRHAIRYRHNQIDLVSGCPHQRKHVDFAQEADQI